jgi:hypothetical protein
MTTFGNLRQVDLRTGWNHEAFDFTKWLVQPENLQLLSDEIGIEIAPIEAEARTGKYSVDILAEEENTGNKIIIENQLEKTDHDHLGKIITYASGYDAQYIVWIVKDANEEHRQAMEWLNENTNTSLNFFLIKLELWQIDNSSPAVKMNLIVKPNEWTKVLRERRTNDELTETKELQLKFWTSFKNYCDDQNATFISRKPRASRAYDIAIGTSLAHIRLTASTMYNEIRVLLVIKKNKELFERYYNDRDSIEEKIGAKLEWEGAPDQKRSLIKLVRHADIANEDEWDEYHKWLLDKAKKFREIFGS